MIQTPKLEGLVHVAKQAIERLRERKERKTEVSGSTVAETEEPPVKRQLMAKGQSKVVGKGKSGAPVRVVNIAIQVSLSLVSAIHLEYRHEYCQYFLQQVSLTVSPILFQPKLRY